MGIVPFKLSDSDSVLRLHEDAFKQLNFSSYSWEPCQQIESLEKDCVKYVYRDEMLKGYGAAYALDETHFRLNLLVAPQYSKQGIGSVLLEEIDCDAARERKTRI